MLQFYIVFNDARKTNTRDSNSMTRANVERKTDNVMNAVKTGKIKKHLLHRKDLGRDSDKVGKGADFLHDNISFSLPLEIEEKRYNG